MTSPPGNHLLHIQNAGSYDGYEIFSSLNVPPTPPITPTPPRTPIQMGRTEIPMSHSVLPHPGLITDPGSGNPNNYLVCVHTAPLRTRTIREITPIQNPVYNRRRKRSYGSPPSRRQGWQTPVTPTYHRRISPPPSLLSGSVQIHPSRIQRNYDHYPNTTPKISSSRVPPQYSVSFPASGSFFVPGNPAYVYRQPTRIVNSSRPESTARLLIPSSPVSSSTVYSSEQNRHPQTSYYYIPSHTSSSSSVRPPDLSMQPQHHPSPREVSQRASSITNPGGIDVNAEVFHPSYRFSSLRTIIEQIEAFSSSLQYTGAEITMRWNFSSCNPDHRRPIQDMLKKVEAYNNFEGIKITHLISDPRGENLRKPNNSSKKRYRRKPKRRFGLP